jgi:hypothetical protein
LHFEPQGGEIPNSHNRFDYRFGVGVAQHDGVNESFVVGFLVELRALGLSQRRDEKMKNK